MRAPLVAVLCACLLAAGADTPTDLSGLSKQIYQSTLDGDDVRTATLIEEYLEASPVDASMLYQAACVYCRLGDPDRAASYLVRAVRAGLHDLDQVASDPDLLPLQDHPAYIELMSRRDRGAASDGQAALARWRSVHGTEHYRYELDRDRRLAYATALDDESHREMVDMLRRQADHLRSALLGTVPSYFVLIAVPTPQDATRLFDSEAIGGLYDHGLHRLIARDIGSSLRHEFFHAMHYGHMEAIRQHHPLWIQEGMASLYEDYVLGDDGSIVFSPNERHNIVKRLAANNRLHRWRDLFRISDEAFMARAGQLYPQVRSIFEYLASEGKLASWYQALVDTFDEDKTGTVAFETTFVVPLQEVERRWRDWVDAQPFVDISVEVGDASLGIETDLNGSNDGVLITRILARSAAAASRLEPGDTIVAIDGHPTRSLAELKAIIAARKIGDRVEVRARRDGRYLTVMVTLRPLEPMKW